MLMQGQLRHSKGFSSTVWCANDFAPNSGMPNFPLNFELPSSPTSAPCTPQPHGTLPTSPHSHSPSSPSLVRNHPRRSGHRDRVNKMRIALHQPMLHRHNDTETLSMCTPSPIILFYSYSADGKVNMSVTVVLLKVLVVVMLSCYVLGAAHTDVDLHTHLFYLYPLYDYFTEYLTSHTHFDQH